MIDPEASEQRLEPDSTDPQKPQGLVCAVCGYDLRDQSRIDDCPECGASVERSIFTRPIDLHRPGVYHRVRFGLWLMVLSLVVYQTLMAQANVWLAGWLSGSVSRVVSDYGGMPIYLATLAIWGASVWLLAGCVDPAEPQRMHVNARRAMWTMCVEIGFGVFATLTTITLMQITGSSRPSPTQWFDQMLLTLSGAGHTLSQGFGLASLVFLIFVGRDIQKRAGEPFWAVASATLAGGAMALIHFLYVLMGLAVWLLGFMFGRVGATDHWIADLYWDLSAWLYPLLDSVNRLVVVWLGVTIVLLALRLPKLILDGQPVGDEASSIVESDRK